MSVRDVLPPGNDALTKSITTLLAGVWLELEPVSAAAL